VVSHSSRSARGSVAHGQSPRDEITCLVEREAGWPDTHSAGYPALVQSRSGPSPQLYATAHGRESQQRPSGSKGASYGAIL